MKSVNLKISVMAFAIGMFALTSCGGGNKQQGNSTTLQEAGEIVEKAAKDTKEGTFTAGAKAKMETLGKSVKDEKLVYYMITSDCREYYVLLFESGKNTEKRQYWFYYEKFAENYKTGVSQLTNMLLDKDDNNLWIQMENDKPSKLSWQQSYDLFKDMKNTVVVE